MSQWPKNWAYLVLFYSFAMVVFLSAWQAAPAFAQQLGIAVPLELAGSIPTGSIISYKNNEYYLTDQAYDRHMVGVATEEPAIELLSSTAPGENEHAMVYDGLVTVRVVTENGQIKVNDMLTSSNTPGAAMRTTQSGYIIGVAQEAYDGTEEGRIPILLTVKYVSKDTLTATQDEVALTDLPGSIFLGITNDPERLLRYVSAAVIMIASLAVAFFTVAKVARSGVEALGRNPLASKTIVFGIVMNIFFSIGIVGMGAAGAYMIITLGT